MITQVTIPAQGPGGKPLTFDLGKLRELCDGYVHDGAQSRAEQALAVICVALIDKLQEVTL